jgi:hypothetical protein
MFLLSPLAHCQQKDHHKRVSWKGEREEIASTDDCGGVITSGVERWSWDRDLSTGMV